MPRHILSQIFQTPEEVEAFAVSQIPPAKTLPTIASTGGGGAGRSVTDPVGEISSIARGDAQVGEFTLEDIRDALLDGSLPEARALEMLQSRGIGDPAAVIRQFLGTGPVVITGMTPGPNRVGFIQPPGSAVGGGQGPPPPSDGAITQPSQVPVTTPKFVASNPFRDFLLGEQEGGDVARRLRAVLGTGLTPLGERGAASFVSRFGALAPLSNFGLEAQRPEEAFQSFLGSPPTQESLRASRQGIIAGGADAPGFRSSVLGEDALTAFKASLQPALAGITPRARGRLESSLVDDFQTRLAQTPDLFQNRQQLFDLFSEFTGFGR